FTYVRNTGIAFGIPANQFFLVFMTSAVVVALLVYLIRYHESQPRLVRIALSSITGGAVGNLIDRIRLGYVVDFVDFQVWPVFNIADSSVVVGVGLLLYFLIFHPEARLQNKNRIDNNNV
ncbi:MAG: signal peptidase II, partial [Dehalococcoidia bacterium]|nr:signal peptidase II [Dehalococcoidia bacterium]